MRIVSITEVRQDATKLVEQAQATNEPILVLQRSKPAAYLVSAPVYDALQDELRHLRHELFWQGVAEAETEYRKGHGSVYDDADALIAGLGLEAASESAGRPPGKSRGSKQNNV